MRRLIGKAFLLAAFVLSAATLHAATESEPQNYSDTLKWANTLIFAAGLGYLLYKSAPKFFNARSADIQKAIQDATGLKIEAEFRSSEIDRKMATLPEEVKRMRAQADIEMEHEHQRLLADAQTEIDHIQGHVQAETEALRYFGALELRQHTAAAAFDLAARRLQEQLTPGDQNDFVRYFAHVVEQGKN